MYVFLNSWGARTVCVSILSGYFHFKDAGLKKFIDYTDFFSWMLCNKRRLCINIWSNRKSYIQILYFYLVQNYHVRPLTYIEWGWGPRNVFLHAPLSGTVDHIQRADPFVDFTTIV